ncbi:MAG: riboflavin biosynthesis protein RibF [Oscillospiraceae bacterium]|nr:riboflavin biosynthesis protein RibF [Oscillospiraceae bacterium]MDD4413271.1 riboflavin biosynthesis protein RibF [Oscillospiraceae bacterium]
MHSTSYKLKTYIWDRKNNIIPRYPRAVALGIFDGVHLGHRAVIQQAVGLDLQEGHAAVSTVFTFTQPAWAYKDDGAWELMSSEQKKAAFEGLGVEEWIKADFEAIRGMTPEEFVNDFLHETLDARRVCCGFNYRFGKGGMGNPDMLVALCAPLGIEVSVVPPVLREGKPISATGIRRLIESGDVEQAARLLGHPFTLDIKVVGGQRLGHLLGTPTINQPLPPNFVRPHYGVYASAVEVDGRVTHGVTNIGVRPTVGAQGPLAETWIADFKGDLYGRNVPVSLIKFLRPEQKFETIEELQKQILRDAQQALLSVRGKADGRVRAVLFDFDDTLQNRTVAFLRYCDFFLKKYFPDLSKEEAEKRSREMLIRNNDGYVNYIDYFMSLIEDWGWEDAPPVGDIYREYQFRFPEYVSLFPEAVEVIEGLKQRGFWVGIITNGLSLTQNRKLDVSGLRPLLDIAVVSGDEHVHKPDPEIFRRAAARLGVPCDSCIFVGDHIVNDIEGSLAAGMHPIYINPYNRDKHVKNIPEIKNLHELFDLIL